jgi:3-dehydroquinate synthase
MPDSLITSRIHNIAVLARDRNEMEFIVSHSARIKAAIVGNDELEHGERRKLNLGHTWGHAVEKVTACLTGKRFRSDWLFPHSFRLKKGC